MKKMIPDYAKMPNWELYSRNAETEYRQCVEEGLDVAGLKARFDEMAACTDAAKAVELGNALFEAVCELPTAAGYPYREPSDAAGIAAERRPALPPLKPAAGSEDRIRGAWLGRICGCLAGKGVEGISCADLNLLLAASGNSPMHRYILLSDFTPAVREKITFKPDGRCFADTVECAPADDDTNYTVLGGQIIGKYGRDFTSDNVGEAWIDLQPKRAYCTAERIAFVNVTNGFRAPCTALYQNPYREWIGAQIRADYYGYINPGDPGTAADMARRDAALSHVKNGIYGEMFVAAMLAAAAVESDLAKIIGYGLDEIPAHSRLYLAITRVLDAWRVGQSAAECFADFHRRYNDRNGHDWCHTISNAELVAASLLYGGGNYGKSICMAIENGFDTDCNGATVGSILGMRGGAAAVGSTWTAPIRGQLDTAIFGVGRVGIDDLVRTTLGHLPN